ncbi:alkaline phosphatase [Tenacibaculum discolor]|uniref:Alkaline phosphatase n=1 Tax=Tenacibaculum discolor TaxID=361581 RepID=A0A2G1BS96_9FLAO|nr:alkaline phosphatase D family protein [Tenacibaculum discolor]MDP2542328.1 alkaline phosphatase D family protein [Tenacibaculum discolor]PHN96912.1 alkaline phosphatase [Tenacibaculum discolor]PHO01599.1 alkaline phosphatase [Rhodobacteraceae bacterium 4F10]
MKTNIKRRSFLRNSLLATGGLLLVPNFISCKDDDIDELPIPDNLAEKNFEQGVASFDPTNSQVIIWTRYNTKQTSATLIWQIAKDKNFKEVVRQAEVTTDASRDFTVAVEIKDLDAGQKLYYRFVSADDKATSPVGETLTFSESINEVKLAVASCANFAYGYFNVYEEIKKSDADVVIHLGDYIYEYGENTYGSFRTPEPKGEIISLDDYRTRYRQYRSDEQLKELHRRKPFICVWDDHEVANDTYKDGAENHQEDEGSFTSRKQSALKAYSEYLPNMTNLVDNSIIYRNLKIGSLVDLIMLDTRIIGRDKQLEYSAFYGENGAFDSAAFQQAWLNPQRTLLGTTQLGWLESELAASNSTWQIIGQQVLMGKMLIPAELLTLLAKLLAEVSATGSASEETFNLFKTSITELVTIKTRALQNDPTLTAEEKARIETVLPYNLDAWDGYFMERERILASFKSKNVVVLAGDTHNAWYSDLKDNSGEKIAVEVATSSVSSPGLETYLGASATDLEAALGLLIDDLQYGNLSQRGYMKLTVTAAGIQTDWNFVDTVTNKTYSNSIGKTVTL